MSTLKVVSCFVSSMMQKERNLLFALYKGTPLNIRSYNLIHFTNHGTEVYNANIDRQS